MKYLQLLSDSKAMIDKKQIQIPDRFPFRFFSSGAQWMHHSLNEMREDKTAFNQSTHYNAWGIFKYGSCLAGLIISACFFYKLHFLLTTLSLLVFYFLEVQLLFLFPLLADNDATPVLTSVRFTNKKIGVWKAMTTVIPIGIYMLIGLFNFRSPFRNWYIGSLAVLIWYENDIRIRIY